MAVMDQLVVVDQHRPPLAKIKKHVWMTVVAEPDPSTHNAGTVSSIVLVVVVADDSGMVAVVVG